MSWLPAAKLPFTESWIFFGSPTPMLCIITIYFFAITYGQVLMKNRQPFKLKNAIRLYNVYQIFGCISFYLVSRYGWNYDVFKSTWRCQTFADYTSTSEEMESIYGLYWYFFLLRMSEFLETIFFVLRKKQKQISALHVYHHVSTVVFLYILNRYSASIMELHVAMFNNVIHIIMYAYYFLSSFGSLTKYLRTFKPVLTAIQIFQLIILLGQTVAARKCGSNFLAYLFGVNFSVLILFFGNFFYKNYVVMRKEAKKE